MPKIYFENLQDLSHIILIDSRHWRGMFPAAVRIPIDCRRHPEAP
jgi:hypothetical protein